MKRVKQFLAGILAAAIVTVATSPAMAQEKRPQSEPEKKAIAFLLAKQGEDGAWSKEYGPAVTAMVVKVLLGSGMKVDDPAVAKAIKFVQSTRKGDGGYYTEMVPIYNTSITLSMLAALPPTDELKAQIKGAQDFVKKGQVADPKSPFYGGFGYGGNRGGADLSNTSFALDALHDSGLGKDDPAIKAALTYVTRSQANSETNTDAAWAKDRNTGGLVYSLQERDPNAVLKEYGSMTYAGLKSFIYAGVTKDDPRVKAAMKWITGNWSLEVNPGLNTEEGLYYYYQTYSKALKAYGEDKITDSKGVAHDWRAELVAALAKRQKDDGHFVNDKRDKWAENNPILATAFAVLALQSAR